MAKARWLVHEKYKFNAKELDIKACKRGLWEERQGAVAVTFALSGMVLLGIVGGGIDYARLSARRSQLQNSTDAGVLAGGNTLKLANTSTSTAIRSRSRVVS